MTTRMPIGTILPFAGDVTDSAIAAALEKQGFVPCIGLSLQTGGKYADLFNSIGYNFGGVGNYFSLPDLRGLFVAGPTDIRIVGNVASFTTALPRNAFTTSSDGKHGHTLNYVPEGHFTSDYCAGHDNAAWNGECVNVSNAGEHGHASIAGGDAETRPINLALDYIIKFADPQP